MATSGVTILGSTGTELNFTAMQILGQYGADIATLTSYDTALALKLLNWYMKKTQYAGGFLWKTKVAFLFINQIDLEYTISSSGAHCATSYQSTIMTADIAASGTVLTLSDTSGMTTNDTILIPIADGTYFSSVITVNSATQVTLTTPITEAVDTNTRVYTYTAKITKPIRVYRFGVRTYSNGDATNGVYDRRLQPNSFTDYWIDVSNKANQSEPVSATYLPLRTTGKVYLQGRPGDTQQVLMFTYQSEVEVVTTGADEPDYPSEWFMVLAFKLAYYLSFFLEIDPARQATLKAEADELFKDVNGSDVETVPMQMINPGI